LDISEGDTIHKTIIIGLDGVPCSLLREYFKKDMLPHIKDLVHNEVHPMKSSVPAISNVSWTSMFTGTNPGTHGIYGFTDFIPNSYTVCFPNRYAIKANPYWYNGHEHLVVNMPGTYPPRPMNGALVSGFVSLDINKAVQPPSLLKDIIRYNYQVDVDVTKIQNSVNLFYKDLHTTLVNRTYLMKRILDKYPNWSTNTFIVTGTDRLLHYRWNQRFNEATKQYLSLVDESVHNVVSWCKDYDQLILLSDHGMTNIVKEVNLNLFLHQQGVFNIDTSQKNKRGGFNNVTRDTMMFSLAPGRIYLHTKDRFPRGHFHIPQDTIDYVKQQLMKLTYQGQPVVKRIYDKQEVYWGPQTHNAPNIVVVPNDGFLLSGTLTLSEPVFMNPPEHLQGMHTDEAFVFTKQGPTPLTIQEVYPCITN